MKHLPNGDLLQDRAEQMASQIYEGLKHRPFTEAMEVDRDVLIFITTQILMDSPERDMLQKIKDYVSNPEMIEQWVRFGRAGAPSLANSIRKSIEGEDNA